MKEFITEWVIDMATSNKDTMKRISKVGIMDATLSNRGGLTFMLRYIEAVGFFKFIENSTQGVRLSAKAKPVSLVVRQILTYFLDGTRKAISGLDDLRKDEGYAATVEVGQEELVSSHAVKRFFGKFSLARCAVVRHVLNHLFVWRLQVLRPAFVKLDIDTEVLDNDDADCREGVCSTYKKKKGFQNLQITWENKIVDAMFRRGTAHTNHGNDVRHSLKRVIRLVRKHYSQSVPIIVTMDSGFLDEKNLEFLNNQTGVGFICFGKLYDSVTEYVKGCDVHISPHNITSPTRMRDTCKNPIELIKRGNGFPVARIVKPSIAPANETAIIPAAKGRESGRFRTSAFTAVPIHQRQAILVKTI